MPGRTGVEPAEMGRMIAYDDGRSPLGRERE
jgi:hypothetical protein